MLRSQLRVLVGIVVLPAYLAASNCCLITAISGHGCMRDGKSNQTCVDDPLATANARVPVSHCSGPAANHSSDHGRAGTGPVGHCCDLVASALVPHVAKVVSAASKGGSFIVATSQCDEAPIFQDLGGAAILNSGSPPTRAAPAQRSRAPPFA